MPVGDGQKAAVPDGAEASAPGRLVLVGTASGLLNTTVGASGPVVAPFFRAATATHVAFVATAAGAQVAAHLSKLAAFSSAGSPACFK